MDDLGLQMGEVRLETANIGPGSIRLVGNGIDTAGDIAKLAADESILPVSFINVRVFGEDIATEVKDFVIKLVEAVVDVEEGGIGDSRRGDFALDGQPRTAHAARGPE